MHHSVADLFSIGIGPSSSHTVGPMRAARRFALGLGEGVSAVRCDLYGSLAATGKGHGTGDAIILGLLGEVPESVDVDAVPALLGRVGKERRLALPEGGAIEFDPARDLDFHRLEPLPLHPNGMHFSARDPEGQVLAEEVFYSLGGGFIATERELQPGAMIEGPEVPHPFDTAAELLERTCAEGLSIGEVMLANESALRPEEETRTLLDRIWQAMQDCVQRGLVQEGCLPGGLKVERRARRMHREILARGESSLADPLAALDWVSLYALAVNEENAAGGRVVTAPTNGAAGILPAVLHYATRFRRSPHPDGVYRFLLTAGAIAGLYKKNASLSGADVGCQGEVGVACSMAAGALVEFLGGTPAQVENAAEIGMEHNLGLTCDPVGGLVQIPCIERNAMASVKAIHAARLALAGDGPTTSRSTGSSAPCATPAAT